MSSLVSTLNYHTPASDRPRILAAFAAAALAHCILLFGIHRTPAPVVLASTPVKPTVVEMKMTPDDPTEVEENDKPQVIAEHPLIESQELFAKVTPDVFIQPPHIIDPASLPKGDITGPRIITSGGQIGPSAPPVFRVSQVDQAPVAVATPSPKFPAELQRQYASAEIKVNYVVNTDGTVDRIRIVSASAPGFERVVEAAMSRWKFRPALKNGKRVATRIEQSVVFKVQAND